MPFIDNLQLLKLMRFVILAKHCTVTADGLLAGVAVVV
jgi:hypothetical protein